MFLRKNVHGSKQGEISDQSNPKSIDALATNKQDIFTFENTASELLEFRLFAIKHGFKYLSRLIEPVVKESLNIAHQLDQRFETTGSYESDEFSGSSQDTNFNLSASEIEYLKWCSLGKSYDEIAKKTGRTETTVLIQMKVIRQKLNTNTDAHSIATAIRLKII